MLLKCLVVFLLRSCVQGWVCVTAVCGLVHNNCMFCILALAVFTNLVVSLNFVYVFFFNRETNTECDVSGQVLLICNGQWLWGFFPSTSVTTRWLCVMLLDGHRCTAERAMSPGTDTKQLQSRPPSPGMDPKRSTRA